MTTKYLSCAETAKLVRAALKESFPGVKFSVKSRTYSAAHTPGPWEISEQPYTNCFYVWTRRDDTRTDRCVAAVKPTHNPMESAQDVQDAPHDIGKDEAYANARLIAAAPALVEALRRATDMAAAGAALRANGHALAPDDAVALASFRAALRAAGVTP